MQEVPLEMQPHLNFHEEITVEDGSLFENTRIIVPTSQRYDLLKQNHSGHLGLSKCLHRAKQTVY